VASIEFEVARHIAVLESGGRLVQETRLWDEAVAAVIRGFEAAFKVTIKMVPRDSVPREAAPTFSGG